MGYIWLMQLGNLASIMSWIPQIIKILKTKDVSGFSIKGYVVLILGMSLLSIHATIIQDFVFIVFCNLNILLCSIQSCLIIYFRNRKFKNELN